MKRFALLIFLALLATARAQTPTSSPSATPPSKLAVWRAELPGGTYEVAIHAMVSVSMHEYVVDGAARVNELNIDTAGNMAARFYFLEPLAAKSPLGIGQSALDRATDLAKEAAGRVGAEQVWEKVVKSYPTTTHAHTIEYRVETEEQLKDIFTSAQTAFETGKTTIYQPPSQ